MVKNVFLILEVNLFYVIGFKKNRIEIRVCCFNCVNYMVCLINNGGIENRILIECNRTDLPDNYAIPITGDYVSDTGNDFIVEFEEFDGLYYNQLRQPFCFTELKAYKFSYTRLCINCKKIFVLKKLHVAIR